MAQITVEQLKEAAGKWSEENSGDYGGNLYENIKWGEAVEVEGLGTIELVDDYGGEGQGDDYWVVFKIGDQLFRVDGWYASYDGGELDGEPYEVVEKPVQRTEYVKKSE